MLKTNIKQNQSARRKVLLNALTVLFLTGIILWGLVSYFHLYDEDFTEDAQVEEYINPVNTRVTGYIREIRFGEHQPVRRGDTLVIIDDSEYRIALKQALAQLKDAEAGHSLAQSNVGISETGTRISDANLEELKARLENEKTNLQRYANLLQEDVIPQYQYDAQQTEYEAMQARYEALRHQKTSARQNTRAVEQRLKASEAALLKAEAAIDLARLNLQYCYITAPFDGTTGRRRIAEGQLLQAGQSLTTLLKAGDKWVTANYTESQIADIHVGDRMKIRVDALPGTLYNGEVEAISGATGSRYSSVPVDNSTGNFVKVQQRFPVKIRLTDDENKLEQIKAGMNVEVSKY